MVEAARRARLPRLELANPVGDVGKIAETGTPGGATQGAPGGTACGDAEYDGVAPAWVPNRAPQFVQNRFAARFGVRHAGQTFESDKRNPRRACRTRVVESCGGLPPSDVVILSEKPADSLFPNPRAFAPSPRGRSWHQTTPPPSPGDRSWF